MSTPVHAVTIPKLGLTMKEGTVVAWHVQPGGAVKAGEPIADIESEKTTAVHESPATGILRRQVAQVGQTLPVGTLIGVIASPEAADADVDAFIANYQTDKLP